MRNRTEEIKARGFNIYEGANHEQPPYIQTDFGKIKLGAKTLDDAIYSLGDYRKIDPRMGDKEFVLRAITHNDLAEMRRISNFYYETSGIYSRMVRYMAYMYRYDWYVTPYIKNADSVNQNKILDDFSKCLNTLDKFGVKKQLGEMALKVIINGAYYGYKVELSDSVAIQELPVNYCRSRWYKGNKPAVEFNMKYFDEHFKDTEQRMKVLKLFPQEFSKGYVLYKQNKLPPQFQGDTSGWYLLDPDSTVKFTANGKDYPMFISVVPLLLDLDSAQDLDRKKTMQRLLKIIIQKMPMDKNGDLIFDVEEAQQLHNNAVQMLGKAVGIDVLTTFADVDVASMADTTAASAQSDDLTRVERQVFNGSGISQMLFNTDGNIALEKSIMNDAANLYNLLLQFEEFLNDIIAKYNKKPKKVEYRVQLLTTTIYNYTEMAKLYKEQTQLGYSKMLPQIALGQSQSSILANAYFENEVLDLVNVFIPPIMSSTVNADILNRNKNSGSATSEGNGEVGRNEKADDEKSEKTIQNRESMS